MFLAATALPSAKLELRLRDTGDGREYALTARGTALADLLPKLSADGSVLAYRDFFGSRWHSFLIAGRAGTAREVCEDCLIYPFFSNPSEAVVQYGNEVVRQNFSTEDRGAIIKMKTGQILDLDLSPDDRWVALRLAESSGSNAIQLVPVELLAALVPPPRNYLWARPMVRVFEFDVLACPRCGAKMRILAAIDRTQFGRFSPASAFPGRPRPSPRPCRKATRRFYGELGC